MTDREEFEVTFAMIQRVPLEAVVACRIDDGYWDEANTNTAGISLAWTFFKIGRGLL